MSLPSAACVLLPALPLQILLQDHPEWQGHPVVVVEDDRPLAVILWANRDAREVGIKPGMKFGQAEAFTKKLRAGVVPFHRLEEAVDQLFTALLAHTPHVEPWQDLPGVFWVDPRGFEKLWGDGLRWAQRILVDLQSRNFVAAVVVGFDRFCTFALAQNRKDVMVLADAREEKRLTAKIPLERLTLPPVLQTDLARLGVRNLGAFLKLSTEELRVRYGNVAAAFHLWACGKAWMPLQARSPTFPISQSLQIEPPDDNQMRLLFGVKSLLHPLIEKLREQSQAVVALTLTFDLKRAPAHQERIETAFPTVNEARLVELVRLRLASCRLVAPAQEMTVELEGVSVHAIQMAWFQTPQRRDLQAAARGLDRVRAAFGQDSVTRARLRPAHLPEARFIWEPTSHVAFPVPEERSGLTNFDVPAANESASPSALSPLTVLPMVRRFFSPPRPLPPRPTDARQEWPGAPHGVVTHLIGPYRITGGWWQQEVQRDYYFAETRDEILWIFYDRLRRRWMLQGQVD